MLEIEVKVPDADHEELTRQLAMLGAERLGEEEQDDLYLNHPCRDFGATDEALRLRFAGGKCVLTYKGHRLDPDSKTREELETEIENPQTLVLLLERLGFRRTARVTKRRALYRLAGVEICLDKVEGLGDFVELEYMGQELALGKKAITDMKKELGLRGNERRSYLELLLDKERSFRNSE